MNIDSLTIGDAKKLVAMFGAQAQAPEQAVGDGLVGWYVIVRCKDAGVHAGVLVSRSGRECHLQAARRLWYWKPAGGAWLDGAAEYGLHSDSKIGAEVSDRILTENCEITVCSAQAESSIRKVKAYVP